MKEKLFFWLCDYSQRIITYIFWIYFLFIILYGFFLENDNIPLIMSYLFWLLFGIYTGFLLAIKVVNYMQSKRNISKSE